MDIPLDLLEAARSVRGNAYVPYSGFRVGAALRASDGTVYRGANIENVSYGLSRCAEQSAIQSMASQGSRSFSEMVIYTEADEPASPCGACRQILYEFAPEADIYLINHRGEANHFKVEELLPAAFGLS